MVLALAVLFALGSQHNPYYFGRDMLNPYTVASASGVYSLWLDPSNPSGSGPATCALSKNGRRLWTKTLPYTWQKAVVGNSGRIGGYAYDQGTDFPGALIVSVLDSSGKTLLEEKTPRPESNIPDAGPAPTVREFLYHPDQERFTLGFGEEWWSYSLLAPKPRSRVVPHSGDSHAQFMRHSLPIVGTPLTLIQWPRYDGRSLGVLFTVNDASGVRQWSRTLPEDYKERPGHPEDEKAIDKLQEESAILRADQPHQFELRLYKANRRVKFSVIRDGKRWRVREVGNTEYRDPPKPQTSKAIGRVPMRSLRPTATLKIPLDSAAKPVMDPGGEFHFVRGDRVAVLQSTGSLLVLDPDGKTVKRIAFPGERQEGIERCTAQVGQDAILVFTSTFGGSGRSEALKVNVETGEVKKLPRFHTFIVDAASGLPDGRFVALITEHQRYTSTTRLQFFDAMGNLLWSHGESGYGGGESELLSPKDVATNGKDQVAVLDVVQKAVQIFGLDGRFIRRLKLEDLWRQELSYPSQISAGPDRSWLIYDSFNASPLRQVDSHFEPLWTARPHFKDDKAMEVLGDPRTDSRGKVWVSDGQTIHRLSSSGMSEATLGEATPSQGLSRVSDLHVSARGRVTVFDDTTIEVHAFDPKGTRLMRAVPLPADFSKRPTEYTNLSVTRSGEFYLTAAEGGDLRFSASGKRLGVVPDRENFGGGPVAEAKDSWRWSGRGLLNEEGFVVTQLQRWPDRRWLTESAISTDWGGNVAVVGAPAAPRDWSAARTHVAFYGPGGHPKSMHRLSVPLADISDTAFDGRTLYCLQPHQVVAVDRKGVVLWRTKVPAASRVFASQGGFALFDGSRNVTWYAATS